MSRSVCGFFSRAQSFYRREGDSVLEDVFRVKETIVEDSVEGDFVLTFPAGLLVSDGSGESGFLARSGGGGY